MTAAPRSPRLIVVERAALAESAAQWLARTITHAARERGRCRIALAGGSTPEPAYRALAARPAGAVPWDTVEVFFGDERAVPPDHPDSNYRMARAALLDAVPIAPGRIHRMMAERDDVGAAADDYARLLADPLDVLLLGVGADGHTASLFPGAPAARERVRRVVPAAGPRPPARRLTITPVVIGAAREILVLAAGADKAVALARAVSAPFDPRALPIQLALRGTWLLDRDAAALLGGVAA